MGIPTVTVGKLLIEHVCQAPPTHLHVTPVIQLTTLLLVTLYYPLKQLYCQTKLYSNFVLFRICPLQFD